MGKFQDLTGQKFGRLTVLKRIENRGKHIIWLCQCKCGKITKVSATHLQTGHTQSCGCYNKERIRETSTKHNQSKTSLYFIWKSIKQRCTNKNSKRYKDYGKRGIELFKDWQEDYKKFFEWSISNGYKKGLSIDRIDNNIGYFPDNCRWTDRVTQANNKRNNVILKYNGEEKTITEWSKQLNIPRQIISSRYYSKWKIEEIFNKPIRGKKCKI